MNEEKRHVLKAVFDTNVLLSALHWFMGNPRRIFEKAVEGAFVLFWCREMMEELQRVIERDFDESDEQIYTRLSVVLTYAEPVEIVYNESVIEDDPDDDIIINCALSADADYVKELDKNHAFQGMVVP